MKKNTRRLIRVKPKKLIPELVSAIEKAASGALSKNRKQPETVRK